MRTTWSPQSAGKELRQARLMRSKISIFKGFNKSVKKIRGIHSLTSWIKDWLMFSHQCYGNVGCHAAQYTFFGIDQMPCARIRKRCLWSNVTINLESHSPEYDAWALHWS